ncbi:MAG: hypothetical protein AB1806_21030 [Acidobacteriota bacterium]
MKRRLLAAAMLAAMAGGPPAAAQMPDARQMSGIPMPTGDTPAGTVVVRLVRGQLGNDIANHPVELHVGAETRRATTDGTGRATFENLPAGVTVHAVAEVDGETLESQSFPLPAGAGVRVLLAAGVGAASTPAGAGPPLAAVAPIPAGEVAFGGQSRIHIEFDDDELEVFYLLELVNPASTPMAPPRELVFELPAEAESPSPLEGSSTQMTLRGRTASIAGPIQPGTTPVQLAYRLSPAGVSRRLTQAFPIAWTPVQVVVTQIGKVQLSSRQLTGVSDMPGDQHAFVFGQGPALPAGTPFVLELNGLPSRTRLGRTLTIVAALLVIGVGVWASWSTGGQSAAQLRRAQLESRRERLMADLARVERLRAAGGDAGRQVERRESLIAQLERVYGELDQQPVVGGGAERHG